MPCYAERKKDALTGLFRAREDAAALRVYTEWRSALEDLVPSVKDHPSCSPGVLLKYAIDLAFDVALEAERDKTESDN